MVHEHGDQDDGGADAAANAPGGARRLASDAERETVVRRLGDAAAEGRLTLGELDQRVGTALSARTEDELDRLVADLPASAAPEAAAPAGDRLSVTVGVLGGVRRHGRWTVPRRLLHVGILGGARLDLTGAELSGREVTITVVSVLGGVRLWVPESVRLEVSGLSLLGGRDLAARRPPPPGAPLVRLRVVAVLGGARVSGVRTAGGRLLGAGRRVLDRS